MEDDRVGLFSSVRQISASRVDPLASTVRPRFGQSTHPVDPTVPPSVFSWFAGGPPCPPCPLRSSLSSAVLSAPSIPNSHRTSHKPPPALQTQAAATSPSRDQYTARGRGRCANPGAAVAVVAHPRDSRAARVASTTTGDAEWLTGFATGSCQTTLTSRIIESQLIEVA